MDAKELYKEISADFRAEKNYMFFNHGEQMGEAREKGCCQLVIFDRRNGDAYEFVDEVGNMTLCTIEDVEIASLFNMPDWVQRNVLHRQAEYWNGFHDDFRNGVACLGWTIQPDGQYYADEDGFGMSNDEEIIVYCFINRNGDVLIPFQPMEEKVRKQYRKMAERINKKKEAYYVCLNPNLTFPFSEINNLQAHYDLIKKVMMGLQIRICSNLKQEDIDNVPVDYVPLLCHVFNPDMENHTMIILTIKKGNENNEYNLLMSVVIKQKGQEPQSGLAQIYSGTFEEVFKTLDYLDNATMLADIFIEMMSSLLP